MDKSTDQRLNDFLRSVTGENCLDLEYIIRITMQFLFAQIKTRCAFFLPSVGDEYMLGGFTFLGDDESYNKLITETLQYGIVPHVSERMALVVFNSPPDLDGLRIVAFPCVSVKSNTHPKEVLAVICLWRKNTKPEFDKETLFVLEEISYVVGRVLGRLARIHNRMDHAV